MLPRRSLLYMPGANARALEKARQLTCDTVIFDLEDAVSPDAKETAREQVVATVEAGGYGYRELVVRANGLDTPWGRDDVAAVAPLNISALLFPKIESLAQVEDILAWLDECGGGNKPIWLMVETPAGVMDLASFCAHERVQALVMGTSDLVKELRTWVRTEIGPIASPDLIQWAPGLPKTRSGKIMRRILRKIASNELENLGDTSTLADASVVENLINNRENR